MKRPLGAQISHMLKRRGVDTIFGIPGVHNVEMYRGIEEAGITHVLARHEQGAGFMADGYARASGRPGVAYVITGPGLTNIMTPMGQAYSDSVPILVISSCLDEADACRGQLHQMRDQRGAAACVCAWSEEARSADAAYSLIDRALSEFRTSRPRPRHLQVPISLLGEMVDPAPEQPAPAALAQVSYPEMSALVQEILRARRPMFILGGGVLGAAEAIPDLLAMTHAAVFTTYAGRGLVPADYPLNCGAYLGQGESQNLLREADLVVAFGTELSECDLWRDELGHQARMVRVDIDPEVLTSIRAGDQALLGDAVTLISAMRTAIPAREGRDGSDWNPARIAALRTMWKGQSDSARPGIAPICVALSEVMPENTMYFSDMTQFAYVAKEVWDMPCPGHWHHPTGFGTLGYALPAAIGGALARPGQPTVAIAGDYGFQYTLQELGTAVELGLSLPILLWDNSRLKEIEDSMVRSQIAPTAVVVRNPDFLKLADAYGAAACQPATLRDLQEAVIAAFSEPRPTLIRITAELAG